MQKQILTYLLLIAFGIIFSPRSIWHSHESDTTCSHDGTKHKHPDDSSDQDESGDCYVCDFTLQPALTPIAFNFNFPHSNNFVRPDQFTAVLSIQATTILTLRGPPVVIS